MYPYNSNNSRIVCFFLFFIELLIKAVSLIGIVYLVSFCCHFDSVLVNMISESSAIVKKTFWINWIWPNHTEDNHDDIFNTPEMIRKAGYLAETHVITTEDGYLLTLHRIPGGNGSLPVLLQHGFLCTSAVWVILGKGKALAYLLADHGYDVWMGNFRGNTYSKAHISLSPSESKFWDFSLNELGIYDLSAMITFITNMSSKLLHMYIGHSLGTTCFYIMVSECPQIARMVQMMINFGPTVFINHMTSPLRYLAFLRNYEVILRFIFHEVMLSDFVKLFLKYSCAQNIIREICANILFIMWGYDHEQFNYTLLPVIINHFPAGGSANTIAHYAQGLHSGKFRKYDYGRAKNLLIYNSMEPPDYDLANIMTPIAIFYGPGDTLVDIVDVKRLYCVLPNVVDMYKVPWPNFNHVDFVWAKDAPKLVYERVFKIMRKEYRWKNVTSAIEIKDKCTNFMSNFNNGYD